MDLITEFEFELPRGYLDENGELQVYSFSIMEYILYC